MHQLEVFIVALTFASCHFAAPWAFESAQKHRAETGSFAGGLAAAYVCLHLLPEIDEGHVFLGPRVYVLVLAGIACVYALEVWIRRGRSRVRNEAAHYTLHIGFAVLYSFLIVFTLALQLPSTPALTAVFAASIGLHLVSGDMGLQQEYGQRFVNQGRYLLVAAVAAGYVVSRLRRPHEAVIDASTAVLAGFILFNVFRREIPELQHARVRPFVLGSATFLIAHALLESAG